MKTCLLPKYSKQAQLSAVWCRCCGWVAEERKHETSAAKRQLGKSSIEGLDYEVMRLVDGLPAHRMVGANAQPPRATRPL